MGDNNLPQSQEQLKDIAKPHDHDVLSGRGNFVNHHAGNENFRKLVKHHKKAYVACPKSQKAIYSKIIYDEIRAMNPPGRFLKQDPKTKLWGDIGEKKALDKTRQALREGAPELLKELGTPATENGGEGREGGESAGGNSEYDGGDYVAPLRMQRMGHPLAESLLGNISLGSFSLGSFTAGPGASFSSLGANPMGASFSTLGTNPMASFTGVPPQVGGGDDSYNNMYGTHGTNSILAAAAQIQAQQQQQQQQHQQQHQQQQNPEWEAQLQLLKAQMQINSQQINAQQVNAQQANHQQQGGGGMGNIQNAGLNGMVAAAQAGNGNGNDMPIGSNEMSALLAAIHNSASGLNNGVGPMGNVVASNATYQQQLAQLAMFNTMNGMNDNSESTLLTGNLNNEIPQMNDDRDNNGNPSGFNHRARQSFASASSQQTQQRHNHQIQHNIDQQPQQEQSQQQQRKFQGGYQEQSYNVSVPLKCMSETHADTDKPMTNVRRPGNMRGNGGLDSSFTRAKRIGLKNSFTQRRPNRRIINADLELKNSLMSIESLTLEDIDGTTMEGMFDTNSEGTMSMSTQKTGANKVHGEGPHDMSEVSELGFEEKA